MPKASLRPVRHSHRPLCTQEGQRMGTSALRSECAHTFLGPRGAVNVRVLITGHGGRELWGSLKVLLVSQTVLTPSFSYTGTRNATKRRYHSIS
jgi:hypothetical protein